MTFRNSSQLLLICALYSRTNHTKETQSFQARSWKEAITSTNERISQYGSRRSRKTGRDHPARELDHLCPCCCSLHTQSVCHRLWLCCAQHLPLHQNATTVGPDQVDKRTVESKAVLKHPRLRHQVRDFPRGHLVRGSQLPLICALYSRFCQTSREALIATRGLIRSNTKEEINHLT
jgi:hypothetical protein